MFTSSLGSMSLNGFSVPNEAIHWLLWGFLWGFGALQAPLDVSPPWSGTETAEGPLRSTKELVISYHFRGLEFSIAMRLQG